MPGPCALCIQDCESIAKKALFRLQQVACGKRSGIRDEFGKVPRIPLRFIQATSLTDPLINLAQPSGGNRRHTFWRQIRPDY